MPHRQMIDAARVQMGAALSHNMLTDDPKELPYVAEGWSIELRDLLAKTVGPDKAAELLKERARELEELTVG